jgi:hypothetical protein
MRPCQYDIINEAQRKILVTKKRKLKRDLNDRSEANYMGRRLVGLCGIGVLGGIWLNHLASIV